ncbi:uncharacterized protein LOC127121518 isoform X1 [Lathyrus oleraceus]|uniref:uncharacterized protein LOC127121518 isoform X1 n=1 Tax=Pisum sativum TaxID=3888 RepID=UPI0021CE84D8|nr:uncharacterized protein LOC127121518 isoform X1 [Pisum sativum]
MSFFYIMFSYIKFGCDSSIFFRSTQCKSLASSTIIHAFDLIWYCMNQLKLHNKVISWKAITYLILDAASFPGNHTKVIARYSLYDFSVSKAFSIQIYHPKRPSIKDILWDPPPLNWVKFYSYGVSRANPSLTTCGGIFKNRHGVAMKCFASNYDRQYAFCVELLGNFLAIKITHKRGWRNLWLETDFKLVSLAFKNSSSIPWRLKNRWFNCLSILNDMNFIVSRIVREGNRCADKLANLGLSVVNDVLFDSCPSIILNDYSRNIIGLPNFRFV